MNDGASGMQMRAPILCAAPSHKKGDRRRISMQVQYVDQQFCSMRCSRLLTAEKASMFLVRALLNDYLWTDFAGGVHISVIYPGVHVVCV